MRTAGETVLPGMLPVPLANTGIDNERIAGIRRSGHPPHGVQLAMACAFFASMAGEWRCGFSVCCYRSGDLRL